MFECFPPDPLRLEVVLPIFTRIPLKEINEIADKTEVSATIPLNVDAKTPVLARISGINLFKGVLGKRDGKLAIRIEKEMPALQLISRYFIDFYKLDRPCHKCSLQLDALSREVLSELRKFSYEAAVVFGSYTIDNDDMHRLPPGSIFTLDTSIHDKPILELSNFPVISGNLVINQYNSLEMNATDWLINRSDLQKIIPWYKN